MTDGIIKGTGTSRAIKGSLPSSYSAFVSAVAAGTQTIDMLFNSGGWQQQPTFLNKANLLTDAVATAYGLTPNATPNDVLNAARTLISTAQTTADGRARCASGNYSGTGTNGSGSQTSLTFAFAPKLIVILDNQTGYCNLAVIIPGRYGFVVAHRGSGSALSSRYSAYLNRLNTSISSNTVSWYSSIDANAQMNTSGTTYYYVAIG